MDVVVTWRVVEFVPFVIIFRETIWGNQLSGVIAANYAIEVFNINSRLPWSTRHFPILAKV